MMLTRKIIYAIGLALMVTIVTGQDIYDMTKQHCCDGNIFDKSRGTRCCGQQLYNTMDNGCCFDQLVDYPNNVDKNYGCCFNTDENKYESYDFHTQQCCDGSVVEKPEPGKYFQCCAKGLYDFTTYSCCGGEIIELNDATVCCGNQMVAIEPETSSACCGDVIIDTETQICCTQYDYDEQQQTTTVTTKVHDMNEVGSKNEKCCGLEVYNKKTDVCCGEMQSKILVSYTLPKPEGMTKRDHPYCCGNEVLLSSSVGNRACCDGFDESESVSYNKKTERCCAGVVKQIDGDNPLKEVCCWESHEFYDTETDACTAAGIKPLSEMNGLAKTETYCMPRTNTFTRF